MAAELDLRPSPIAGKWYPADPDDLAGSVDTYLEAASLPELDGEVIAVVAPHAGYMYSGRVAGYAFAALAGLAPEVVAVISPMHYPYDQALLTTAHSAYQTPLGLVPIDREAIRELNAELEADVQISLTPVSNDPEHSLEIELPFLQRVFRGGFRLIPVMVHRQTLKIARALGHTLAKVLSERKAVIVASTDLSHFYSQEVARNLDAEMLRRIRSLDPRSVLDAEKEGVGFACGHGALAAVLWASKLLGGNQARILKYATSGDVTGDYSQVVGYAAAVIMRSK